MAVNENIMVTLTANISDYSAKMQAAAAQTGNFANRVVQPTDRLKQLDRVATNTGLAVGAMGVAFGVSAVKSFAEFDEAMSNIRANTGATGDELNSLRDAALEAGKSTVYNAKESADAITELAKAGMSTTDVLNGGLSGALNLAASDGMAVASAAELMASTLAQFNLQGKDAGRVADALAGGAAAAQGSASDLGYALSQAGLVAHSFGISMEETTGALALFANQGMIGSDAGTSLKTMLQSLANPSTKAARTMKELGISAYDAQGNFVGLEELAGQLQTAMSGLSQEQRNAAMATIFGSDAVRAANALYNAGAKGVAQWTKTVSESGVAAQMAATMTDNLKGDIEQFGGAIETALISSGSGFNDTMRGIVQGATSVVDAFASLDSGTQKLITVSALAVGGLALLHKSFGGLQQSSSSFGQAMGLMLDPVQRLSGAIPSFVGGVAQIRDSFKPASVQMQEFGTTISRTQGVMGGLKSFGSGIVSLLGGPWGIAMTIAGVALMNFAKKAQEAKARTQELESAIKNGADVNAKIVDAINSIDYGWYDKLSAGVGSLSEALEKAGISQAEFARAIKGSEPDIDTVNEKISALYNSTSGYGQAGEQARLLKSDLAMLSNEYSKAAESGETAKAATDELAASESDAQPPTEELGDEMGNTSDSAEKLADAIDDLVKHLFDLEGTTLNSAEAQVALDKEIRETVEALESQGKVLDDNGNYLDGMQKQGEEAKNTLFGLADQAMRTATAILKEGEATGDMQGATDRAGEALERAREAFIRSATAAGYSDKQAKILADSLGLTKNKTDDLKNSIDNLPENKKVNIEANVQRAIDNIKSVRDALALLQDKSITLTTTQRTIVEKQVMSTFIDDTIRGSGASGAGEYVRPRANGGYLSGTGGPRADSMVARVSAGEYVVNAMATARNRAVLDAMNFGGKTVQIPAYADGGYVQPTPAYRYLQNAGDAGNARYVQNVNNNIRTMSSPYVQASIVTARMRTATRQLLGGA